MSETDHTPKMFSKFIQLVSHDEHLYALDDNGDVWMRQADHQPIEWLKCTMTRGEFK